MFEICFVNGEYKSVEDVSLKPDDIGLLRGYGTFEVMRTYNGKLFEFDQHMARLKNSADILNIQLPYSEKEIKQIIHNLKDKNDLEETYVRVLVTGGRSETGMDFDPANPTFIVMLETHEPLPKPYYKEGVELLTLEHKRNVPESKITNYLLPISKKNKLEEEDKYDFLYTYQGDILESVTSNFFLVKDGKLITPKEDMLEGITRSFVLKITSDEFEQEVREVKVEELHEADEAFLTATNKKVLPVVQVDDITIGDSTVGEHTRKIMELFDEKTNNY